MTFDTNRIAAVAQAQLAGDPEAGASLCIIHDGKEVFSQAWGLLNSSTKAPYTEDSLQIAMSMGKGALGTLTAILIDRGLLDPEEKVARYWPEFAANGKGDITVAQLFSHQAGLAALDVPITLALLADRQKLADALAAQAPLWKPGTAHGYHAITLGCYVDILFERVSGKSVRGLLEEYAPLMGAEIYSELPESNWHRVAQVHSPKPLPQGTAPAIDPVSLLVKVLTNMPEALMDRQAFWNGEAIRTVSIPGTNMFSNARSLARMYAGLCAGGVWQGQRLCSPEAIAVAAQVRVRGTDLVNNTEMAYGLNFQRPSTFSPFSKSDEAYGNCGAGGSFAFVDPRHKLAIAWIPSQYSAASWDPRAQAVVDAVYASI